MSGPYDVETQGFLDRMAAQTPAQPPATLGAIWDAQWKAAGLSTLAGLQDPAQQARQQLDEAYQGATGRTAIDDAHRIYGVDLSRADNADHAGVMGALADSLSETERAKIDPYLDTGARARRIAAETERQASDVAANTWGLPAHATAWLAGLARNMVDPVNVAAVVATGPALGALGLGVARGLATHAAIDFATNAGLTAVQHPFVSVGREDLGLQTSSLVQDALEAGAAGVALGGLLRAGGWALGKAFGGGRPAPAGEPAGQGAASADVALSGLDQPPAGWTARPRLNPDAAAAAQHLDPADFNAAARFVENREIVEQSGLGFGLSRWALARQMDNTARELEAGGLAAWHASPHTFDEFSLSAVGSGEGAQAFSHGLYFAENVRVGLHYLRQFGPDSKFYRVNLDTAPERLIDWDKPIAAQPEVVQRAFRETTGLDPAAPATAEAFPTAGDWVQRAPDAPAFSRDMAARGIDGVQYLDAISRQSGEGTRNFVMFDEAKVRILNRHGEQLVPRPAPRPAPTAPKVEPIEIEPAAAPAGSKKGPAAGTVPAAGPDAAAPASGALPALPPEIQAMRADAEAAIARAGDFQLEATTDAGPRQMTARALLEEADGFMAAVREFKDCILTGGAAAATGSAA